MTLGGSDIFGDQCKQFGPSAKYRAQRHYLPGIDGCRIYRLGADVSTIRVRGRLTGTSRVNLEFKILAAKAMIDGQLRTFVSDGGTYINCTLDSFETGQISAVSDSTTTHTCTCEAVMTQVAP